MPCWIRGAFDWTKILILVVHIGQQTTGINCILFYAASIFNDAGLSDANLASILLGTIVDFFHMK